MEYLVSVLISYPDTEEILTQCTYWLAWHQLYIHSVYRWISLPLAEYSLHVPIGTVHWSQTCQSLLLPKWTPCNVDWPCPTGGHIRNRTKVCRANGLTIVLCCHRKHRIYYNASICCCIRQMTIKLFATRVHNCLVQVFKSLIVANGFLMQQLHMGPTESNVEMPIHPNLSPTPINLRCD